MNYYIAEHLINNNNFVDAESVLKLNYSDDAHWHYLYSKILLSKHWFDSALNHLKKACTLAPNSSQYKDELVNLIRRNKRYTNDYYSSGYRQHNNRGCSCYCCDDCCCDCNFSCCDLICLDTCCECMGGDLIDCI